MKETTVAVPLADGRWLGLTVEEFRAAVARGAALGLSPAAPGVSFEPANSEQLLNSREMGKLLGIHDTTIEARAKRGQIPCVRIGKALRFKASAVLAALQEG